VWHTALQQGKDDYGGASDTYVWIDQETPRGSHGRLYVKGDGQAATLIRFDLPDWMRSNYVYSAELFMRVRFRDKVLPATIGAYPLRRPWEDEWATWTKASSTDLWTEPGIWPSDSYTTPASVQQLDDENAWYGFDVTEVVAGWLAHPETNHGLLLRGDTSGSVTYHFASSQDSVLAYRPRLVLSYGRGTPLPTLTPTPTSTPYETAQPNAHGDQNKDAHANADATDPVGFGLPGQGPLQWSQGHLHRGTASVQRVRAAAADSHQWGRYLHWPVSL
jgi:hypothetical protein